MWIRGAGELIMWAKRVGEVWQRSGFSSVLCWDGLFGVCLANLAQRMLEAFKDRWICKNGAFI